MQLFYETERLIIKILNQQGAKQVLRFYESGKECFEKVEPERTDDFYTLSFQKQLLDAEFNQALSGKGVRFFLSPQEQPELIIGTISFYHMLKKPFSNCKTGYKIDPNWQGQGYASEAMPLALQIVAKEFHMHRVEAYVLPDNYASIRMLEKCRFTPEGTAFQYTFLDGEWKDHLRYSYICPSVS